MNHILSELTDPQLEAVTHMKGPMIVVAGAGSGKTRVVTRRIAYLISKGVLPNQILAVTFTNKAASEMKARVEELVGISPPYLSTFHSVCARFLRRDIELLGDGRTRHFTIYDTSDQKAVVKQAVAELGLSAKDHPTGEVLQMISRSKTSLISPGALRENIGEESAWDVEIYEKYEDRMRLQNALDFDDLLVLMVRLLKTCPHVRESYQRRFKYILVDEYQDTNHLQYKLLSQLINAETKNIHVTGDPDQSIYSWRGADYSNIMNFTTDYPESKVVRLDQNYRSTKKIIDVANHLIEHNIHRISKSLFTENSDGATVNVVRLNDDRQEAEWVINQIISRIEMGVEPRDIAIFYRTNAQSRSFEEKFIYKNVPYQIIGGLRFYERKEVKDLLAHMRFRANPRDSISFSRIANLRKGIGKATITKIIKAAESNGLTLEQLFNSPELKKLYPGRISAKIAAFMDWAAKLFEIPDDCCIDAAMLIYEHSELEEYYNDVEDTEEEYENRIENMQALIQKAGAFSADHPDGSLGHFLEEVALVADIDQMDSNKDCISLMTLHSSKGLEFPCVFIAGLEQELLPHRNSETPSAIEEERRLFFVGITRAREELSITHCRNRFVWNSFDPRVSSVFLQELPRKSINMIDNSSGGRSRSASYNYW